MRKYLLVFLFFVAMANTCPAQSPVIQDLLNRDSSPLMSLLSQLILRPQDAARSGLTDSSQQRAFRVIARRALNPVSLDSIYRLTLANSAQDSLEMLDRYYRDPDFRLLDSLVNDPAATLDAINTFERTTPAPSAKRWKLLAELDSVANLSTGIHALFRVRSVLAQSIHVTVRFGKDALTDEMQQYIINSADSAISFSKVKHHQKDIDCYQLRNLSDEKLEEMISHLSLPICHFANMVQAQLILSALNYAFTRFDS
jgi:hypothetical protein